MSEYDRKLVSDASARRWITRELSDRVARYGGDAALEAEGLNRISTARRDPALDVPDRITPKIDAPDAVVAAAKAHTKLIREDASAGRDVD